MPPTTPNIIKPDPDAVRRVARNTPMTESDIATIVGRYLEALGSPGDRLEGDDAVMVILHEIGRRTKVAAPTLADPARFSDLTIDEVRDLGQTSLDYWYRLVTEVRGLAAQAELLYRAKEASDG